MLLDGLSSSRMLCKALSCAKLAWMIDAVLVAIGHVSGSHQLGRDLHEDITFSILDQRLRSSRLLCALTVRRASGRKLRVELFKSISSIDRGATVNRSLSAEAYLGCDKRRGAWASHSKKL